MDEIDRRKRHGPTAKFYLQFVVRTLTFTAVTVGATRLISRIPSPTWRSNSGVALVFGIAAGMLFYMVRLRREHKRLMEELDDRLLVMEAVMKLTPEEREKRFYD